MAIDALDTELLEAIVLLLPMRDVIVCRSINKAWTQFIDNSPIIQKALFIEPISPACGPGQLRISKEAVRELVTPFNRSEKKPLDIPIYPLLRGHQKMDSRMINPIVHHLYPNVSKCSNLVE
jgi:hypothetical protein